MADYSRLAAMSVAEGSQEGCGTKTDVEPNTVAETDTVTETQNKIYVIYNMRHTM